MNKTFIIVIATVVIGIGSISSFLLFSGNGEYTFQTIETGTFKKTVQVSGKVAPIRDAHLGFETSGTIKQVLVEVGDSVEKGEALVRLDNSSIGSQLSKAQADLQAEVATLTNLSSGNTSTTEVESVKKTVIASLQSAYTTADNAVKTQAEQLFRDDNVSKDPEIIEAQEKYNLQSYVLNRSINTQYSSIDKLLSKWGTSIRGLAIDNLDINDIEETKLNLKTTLTFLDDVVTATSYFVSGSVLTQSQIDTYRSIASTARSSVQNSYADVVTKEESLRSVISQIPLQEAKIDSATANVEDFRVQLSKTEIRAPFSGIVSQQDSQTGEVAKAGISLVSLISSEGLKLEVFIPEVNIAGISPGQDAFITLDAYGADTIFEAKVVSIDPTETIKDGVSTYKTTFFFKEKDERVRSGMTADVSIITDQRENILLLPRRAIIEEGGEKYVLLKINGDVTRIRVQTGADDSYGNTEVLGGLEAGAVVILNPTH